MELSQILEEVEKEQQAALTPLDESKEQYLLVMPGGAMFLALPAYLGEDDRLYVVKPMGDVQGSVN